MIVNVSVPIVEHLKDTLYVGKPEKKGGRKPMHHPKGDMCLACTQLHEKCDRLPFYEWAHKRAKPDDEGDIEVICRAFVKQQWPVRDFN